MNKEHENKNEKRTHAKPNTFVVEGDGEWFVANGYEHPDNLIDHDANLDEPEAFFGIFAAYNQHNIANDEVGHVAKLGALPDLNGVWASLFDG